MILYLLSSARLAPSCKDMESDTESDDVGSLLRPRMHVVASLTEQWRLQLLESRSAMHLGEHVGEDEEDMEFNPLGTTRNGGGRRQGGKGIARLDIAARRPYQEADAERGVERRATRNFHMAYWNRRYFQNPPREGSLAWDEFRLKFRTPWPIFNWLLEETRRSGDFPDELKRNRGRQPAPLGLKVAVALRYLALGVPADGLEESSELSPKTIEFFLFGMDRQEGADQEVIGWYRWFKLKFQGGWLSLPSCVSGIKRVQKVYDADGFPGGFTSMDAVHTPWDNCPSQDKYLFVGKEGYPTLVWNVHVTHNR